MPKSKVRNKLGTAEEEELQGLEIISVGSLYTGPWDKKYWSCSRGKDRYPYPVGYQACRTYGGSSCKMEIQEGPKGPMFMITSADGHSSSGETPDIAWDKFQRKGFPRMKIWLGKRYSCKTDGLEVFGFKNPFVQRLLRELVANVNEIPEWDPLSSSFWNGTSIGENKNGCPESSGQPNLLEDLASPQVTGKRSKRCQTTNAKSLNATGVKRPRPGDPAKISEASTSVPSKYEQHNPLPSSSCDFNERQDSCGTIKTTPAMVSTKSTAGENKRLLSAKVVSPGMFVDSSDCSRQETTIVDTEDKLLSYATCKVSSIASKLPTEEHPVNKPQNIRTEESSLSMGDKAEAAAAQKDSQGVQDVELCAPDSLDFTEGVVTHITPCNEDIETNNAREGLNGTAMVIVEEVSTESHLEEEAGVHNSYSSSERSDCDSVAQDVAKSMMTLLLPQAIPLLRQTSSKKKKSSIIPEKMPGSPKSHEESCERRHFAQVQSSGGDRSPVPDSELVKSVFHDSFDEQCVNDSENQLIRPFNDVALDQLCDEDLYPPCIREQYPNGELKASVSDVETSESKDIYCHEEKESALSKWRGGELVLAAEIQSSEKDPKTVYSNEAMAMGNADAETSRQSPQKHSLSDSRSIKVDDAVITNVSKKVYRRKKVANAGSTKRSYKAPLSESIICRNFEDDYAQELKKTLPDAEALRTSSLNDETIKNDSISLELNVAKQFNDAEGADSNKKLASVAPSSQIKIFVGASEFVDPLNHVPATSHEPHTKCVGMENFVEGSGPLVPQQQGTVLCYNNTSDKRDTGADLGMKANRNVKTYNELDGDYGLVGCYFHSLPVLSLLLNTNGSKIFFCTVCGVSVDKTRTLFLYQISLENPRTGTPSFIGYTPFTLPSAIDMLGREIVHESCGLQLTTDGQFLVMLSSAKAPCCRVGRSDCQCSACASECFDCKSVKIVQVKCGYVSVLLKLRTSDSLNCLLVCGSKYLSAAGESGRLHLWTMNPTWSASIEEFVVPAKYDLGSSTVELKRIPNCTSLVVGHNGLGEFILWDISRCCCLSKFSTPSISVHQFYPICVFRWQLEVHGLSYFDIEENLNHKMDATNLGLSEHNENHLIPPLNEEDGAIWLLVSTASSCDAQTDCISSDCQNHQWRLALMVKNMLVLGNPLDPRASAIGMSAGHGLIGTLDGHVYAWEFLSGAMLGSLHHFKDNSGMAYSFELSALLERATHSFDIGGHVSCIATDNSSSGALAVADDTGQVLVYQRFQSHTL